MTLSTHVLDTGRGEPVPDLPVRLEFRDGTAWRAVADARTDADGRLRDWVPAHAWRPGAWRLVFDTGRVSTFFPEVTVAFTVTDPDRHLHVPLLLSGYGYSTYRGS